MHTLTQRLFFGILAIPCGLSTAIADEDSPSKRWEPSIQKFEAADQEKMPPANGILFVGSSSIRMWDLEKSFPKWSAINRGFGGSQTADVNHYFKRIVQPYKPRIVILYEGDNDIGKGKSPETVAKDFRQFMALMKTHLPESHVVFIPIKPSVKRWSLWPKMNDVNIEVQKIAAQNPKLTYADTASPMLKLGSPPPQKLFKSDGLHLSPEGYRMWSDVVRKTVEQIQKSAK